MATGTETGRTNPQPIPQASHRGAPAPTAGNAVSPPSKRELASWWKVFRKGQEKSQEKGQSTDTKILHIPSAHTKVNPIPGIFGVPLAESIRYANVAISLANENGESFIYGYVPIVVAKCGVFLKEKATDVEGIFRLNGSAKRIKDLQVVFNSPERYGKGLDWTGYTVHDAANILRRYLNLLPEPIVPLDQYERFRDPLRAYQQHLEGHMEAHGPEISAAEHANAVIAYQKLITELPALNRQLLLYILDLLAVFASKADMNRMTAANLAAIFQPGIISHPIHDMAPQEYRLSQDVLIFLIENQDNFLIGMTGTAVDEKTQKDVESGPPSIQSPKSNIGRSASNASAGADSLRKRGIRRNVSVSSHASRERISPNVSSPGTPSTPSYGAGTGSIGVTRSNTVPSKRSPAIGQHRFQRGADPSTPTSPVVTNTAADAGDAAATPGNERPVVNEQLNASPVTTRGSVGQPDAPKNQEVTPSPFPEAPVTVPQGEMQQPTIQVPNKSNATGQTRDRKISNLLSGKSPFLGPSDAQQNQSQRQPKKLQKRQKIPGSSLESAQSSAASLQADDPFHTSLVTPDPSYSQADANTAAGRPATNQVSTPSAKQPIDTNFQTPPPIQDTPGSGRGIAPQKSPATSLRSGTSMTDPSDFDALDDHATRAEKKKHRWRFSASASRNNDDGPLVPPPPIGQLPGARASNSSIGSSSRARQSFTAESQLASSGMTESSAVGHPSALGQYNYESMEAPKEGGVEVDKKGLFGKWRAKMTQSREERREREAEKERAKSPPRVTGDHASSRNSLSAFAYEHFSPRGRSSFDKSREEILPVVNERAKAENKGYVPPVGIASPNSGGPITSRPVPTAAPTAAPQVVPEIIPGTDVRAVPTTPVAIHAGSPVDGTLKEMMTVPVMEPIAEYGAVAPEASSGTGPGPAITTESTSVIEHVQDGNVAQAAHIGTAETMQEPRTPPTGHQQSRE